MNYMYDMLLKLGGELPHICFTRDGHGSLEININTEHGGKKVMVSKLITHRLLIGANCDIIKIELDKAIEEINQKIKNE